MAAWLISVRIGLIVSAGPAVDARRRRLDLRRVGADVGLGDAERPGFDFGARVERISLSAQIVSPAKTGRA